MATTLFENFRIKTMTAAMTLTLTEGQKLEAVERAKALKTSNIAKKKLIAQAAVEETAGRGLGERELRKRANASGGGGASVKEEEEEDEGAAAPKKTRKGPSENEMLKKRNAELEAEITELKKRVAELEAKLLATLV